MYFSLSNLERPAASLLLALIFLFSTSACTAEQATSGDGIRPYAANPFYWEYNGNPVLLIGGSVEDNLFQVPDLERQLDLLQQAGGNYVRNTMSSRDAGNLWAYEQNEEGLYDLNRPNEAYWQRFEAFLEKTAARDVIVQIEVWATFDFYDDREMRRGFWQHNPFNPRNNVNYTEAISSLPDTVASHPTQTENPFFYSVPSEENNTVLLPYQEAFVDRLLSYSLQFGNVLYCMDNETSVTPAWGSYWASYIKRRAAEQGKRVYVTEMWDPWDLAHEMHSNTFDHPEVYDFVDVSQNNHNSGQLHWDNAQLQRARILESGKIRPLNNVKIYGAETSRFGSERDGLERFWRNIFGGMASVRFHRPESGIGIDSTARVHLRSARQFLDAFDVFTATPMLEVLKERGENEAYAMEGPGGKYAVLFMDGGEVVLDTPTSEGQVVRWLEVGSGEWREEVLENEASEVRLAPAGEGIWIAIKSRNQLR